MEEREGETIYQPIMTNPSIEGISTIESGEEYSSFENTYTSTPY